MWSHGEHVTYVHNTKKVVTGHIGMHVGGMKSLSQQVPCYLCQKDPPPPLPPQLAAGQLVPIVGLTRGETLARARVSAMLTFKPILARPMCQPAWPSLSIAESTPREHIPLFQSSF